jgi:monofunctional biosynthetic peptidoglycan transglycosylase
MGDGVFGAEAAAKHYFSTSAAALDRYDAYYIANSLSNPRLYLK